MTNIQGDKENNQSSPFRQRAEDALRGKLVDIDGISREDIQLLLHELQVHQEELNIQNEELRRIQLELEFSRDQYVDLYNNAPVGYCTLNRKGYILEANHTLAASLGVSPEQLIHNYLSKFVNGEDQDLFYLYCKAAFAPGDNHMGEIRMVKRTGEIIYIHLKSVISRQNKTKVIRVILTDITEPKQVAEKLAYLATFPEQNPHPIIEVSLDGKIRYSNPAARDLLLDLQTLGKTHPWLVNWEKTAQIFENRQTITFIREVAFKDRWYQQMLYFWAEKDLIRIYGIDVTEKVMAEKALRESEERFRVLADSNPSLIWVTDAQGNNRYVNRTFCEYFGVTLEQVEGSKWQPLVHPEDGPAYVSAFLEAAQTHTVFKRETRVKRKDGEWRWMLTYAEPRFTAKGEYLGHIGNSSDITEALMNEEETRIRTVQIELHHRLLDQREQERLKIARDLHDGPVQTLTSVTFTLYNMLTDQCSPLIAKQLQALLTTLQEQIKELRDYAGELRSPTLMKFGLGKAISSHINTLKENYPNITFQYEEQHDLSPK